MKPSFHSRFPLKGKALSTLQIPEVSWVVSEIVQRELFAPFPSMGLVIKPRENSAKAPSSPLPRNGFHFLLCWDVFTGTLRSMEVQGEKLWAAKKLQPGSEKTLKAGVCCNEKIS